MRSPATPPNLPFLRGGAKLSLTIFNLIYDEFPLEKWDSCPLPLERGGLGWGKYLRIISQQTCVYTVASLH